MVFHKWTIKTQRPFSFERIRRFCFDLYLAHLDRVPFPGLKIGLVNSGFIKVGAQSVDLTPKGDDEQSTEKNL